MLVEIYEDFHITIEDYIQNICFVNNLTDPIIYAFMSRYFRRDLLHLARKIFFLKIFMKKK
jgi:hypothetical protein